MTVIPKSEVLRYLGIFGVEADAATDAEVSAVIEKYQKEIEPKHFCLELPCSVTDEGVEVGGIFFDSAVFAKHVKGCEKLLLFAATLGTKADILARSLSIQSMARGAIAQACGAAMIEQYCDDVCAELSKKYSAQALNLTARFSPGYGGLALETQHDFFALTGIEKRIGVTLTSSCMMTPSKSVTAFIGLDPLKKHSAEKCAACDKIDCKYRRTT